MFIKILLIIGIMSWLIIIINSCLKIMEVRIEKLLHKMNLSHK